MPTMTQIAAGFRDFKRLGEPVAQSPMNAGDA
jgi:hypothetical protein